MTCTLTTWGVIFEEVIWPPLLEIAPDEEAMTGLVVVFVEPTKMALLLTTTLCPLSSTIEYGVGLEFARLKEERASAMPNRTIMLMITNYRIDKTV